MITKKKLEKLRDRCKLRYLISQNIIFTWLCLLKIVFFIQSKDKRNRHTYYIDWIK
jgi:hypothetical protein